MRTLIAVVVLSTGAAMLHAQGQSPANCGEREGQVRQEVALGHGRALERLQHCPEQATRVLVDLWRETPRATGGADILPFLREASATVRNPTIFAAIDAAARDPGNPEAARLQAMQVLVKYVDPSQALPTPALATIQPGSTLWGCADCGSEGQAREPDPSLRGQALGTFIALSGDPSPDIKRVATAVFQALASQYSGDIPLIPGMVTVSWDCHSYLTVTNRSAAGIPMTVRYPGSGQSSRFTARGGENGEVGVTRLLLEVTIPIEVLLGEHQMLTTACPVTR